MILRPFFSYYGAKHRACAHLPAPEHARIVEPFAGSAAYACRYPDRDITLCDIDPTITALWRYLVRVSEPEIRALPDIDIGGDAASLPVHEEARILIGFWLNRGASAPRNTPSAWMRSGIRPASFWGPEARERIASQVTRIRHWKIVDGSYAGLDTSARATWIVDPPYRIAGARHYRHGSRALDFDHLSAWCRSLPGTAIVHENDGADWLPFVPWMHVKANESRGGGKISKESLCVIRDGVVCPDLAAALVRANVSQRAEVAA
jgi:hypothetical protein